MRFKNILLKNILIVLLPGLLFGFGRKLPDHISVESSDYSLPREGIEFLRDLTYRGDSCRIADQEIYPRAYQLIDSAEKFLVLDIFLFIESSVDSNPEYIRTTELLTQKLIDKKNFNPLMPIYFITDEFNIFYYSHKNSHLERMKEAGIEVIITDMLKFRDSHQPYSLFWRIGPRWFGNPNYKGTFKNLFTDPKEKMAIRSILKLFNFKANHRKIILSEKAAIVTSANPHTASSLHSNIGFYVTGEVLKDILDSEKAVAQISKSQIDIDFTPEKTTGPLKLKYITEGKIRKHLVKNIDKLNAADSLDISVFYMSDRKVVKAIREAKERGVTIRLLLDANKDAFGKQKNGIPNRQVAWELVKKGVAVRWANTHGEQFHTKIAIFTQADSLTVIGGSANFTKRNIGDKNLEADLLIRAARDENIALELKEYFDLIWYDERFSMDFEHYKEAKFLKYWIYRYQEFAGMGTF
ncbi:MAG: phospholipase [Candidatus Marinimicrobia bacterium]|nr:phospholipase [Candidatus Neomarinimicrobiota bacterium]